jgi:hypothetical protein
VDDPQRCRWRWISYLEKAGHEGAVGEVRDCLAAEQAQQGLGSSPRSPVGMRRSRSPWRIALPRLRQPSGSHGRPAMRGDG